MVFVTENGSKIESGAVAIVILHSPREKVWGVIREISTAGVYIAAIDLDYFEDWARSIASGEPHLEMEECFFPMWRVERITLDAPTEHAPSLAERFSQITGTLLKEHLPG
jgi:hypothetical protein